jgi:hypothetical protein
VLATNLVTVTGSREIAGNHSRLNQKILATARTWNPIPVKVKANFLKTNFLQTRGNINLIFKKLRIRDSEGNLQSQHLHGVNKSFLLPCRTIGEKVFRSERETIFIWGFEVEKGDRLRVQPEGYRLQGED